MHVKNRIRQLMWEKMGPIKTEKGMAVFYLKQPQAFSLLVAGKDPTGSQNKDGSLLIQTDTNGVTVNFIKTAEFLDKKKSYTENETLQAYKLWDIANKEAAWKTKLASISDGVGFVKVFNLTNNVFPTKLVGSAYWGYTIDETAVRSFYQAVLLGDVVLEIGTTFTESVKVEEVRASIKTILESITLLPPQKITPKKKPAKRTIKKN